MNKFLWRTLSAQKVNEMALADSVTQTTIIAIDGPAGSGKSTVAREVAKRLGFTYLDTGAMYRSLTLKALRLNVNLTDEQALVQLAEKTKIYLYMDDRHQLKVFLDEEDVSEAIRTPEVTNQTFYIARVPGVRAILVQRQRDIGSQVNVVAEGRDIGTVVFPHATKKFYLDADFEERASRRFKELQEKNPSIYVNQIQKELKERDHKDFTRCVGPLTKAKDAVVVNSTHMSIDEVVEQMIKIIHKDG